MYGGETCSYDKIEMAQTIKEHQEERKVLTFEDYFLDLGLPKRAKLSSQLTERVRPNGTEAT